MKTTLIWLAVAAALVWYMVRKPLARAQAQKVAGVQAAVDAATMNGYTTYNTQIYSEPVWQPFLKFFKAGAYFPASNGSGGSRYSDNYTLQG